jgi:hypothetical protein
VHNRIYRVLIKTCVGAAAAAGTATDGAAAGAAVVAGTPTAAPTMGIREAAAEALTVVGAAAAEAQTLTAIAAACPRPLTNNHLGTRGLVIDSCSTLCSSRALLQAMAQCDMRGFS